MLNIIIKINRTILTTKHRFMLFVLMIINVIASGLEALSMYLFLPIFNFLNDPLHYRPEEFLIPVFSNFINSFNHPGVGTFILILVVFFLKAIVMSLISYFKNNIVTSIRHDLSINVFAKSIFQNYQSFVKSKISVMMNNITASISHLSNGILFSLLNIIIDIVMITAITIVLVANTSWYSLVVPIVIGLISIVLIRLFKIWANWAGNIRQNAEAGRMQVLRECFSSILEVKIYNVETYFLNLFKDEEHNHRKAGIALLTMSEIPKYILEFLGVITIFCFFIISYLFGDTNNLLITNGLFAVAVIKLLPSLSRIVTSYNAMRAAIPAYNQVEDLFSYSAQSHYLHIKADNKSSFKSISSLVINKMEFRYSLDTALIVDGINISLKRGCIYGLIGESGSGKTTVLNILSGVLAPTSSETKFLINGTNVDNYSDEINGHIGYVPQSPHLSNRSIASNIAFGEPSNLINRERVYEALANAEAINFVDKLSNGIDHVLSDAGMNLSGGQRQRLALARVLYRTPSIIILDEATNALDQRTVNGLLETIKQLSKNIIIIIVSHSESMIDFCDTTISLKQENG